MKGRNSKGVERWTEEKAQEEQLTALEDKLFLFPLRSCAVHCGAGVGTTNVTGTMGATGTCASIRVPVVGVHQATFRASSACRLPGKAGAASFLLTAPRTNWVLYRVLHTCPGVPTYSST